MEINNDMIIKYLLKKKEQPYSFENQKNIMTWSNKFPTKFLNLFGDKFYKIGVTQMYDNKNISFYTSFLTLLFEEVMTLTTKEEINKITSFSNDLVNKLSNIPDNLKQISKEAFKKYIKNTDSCIWVYELIVHVYKFNFLIFDFKTNDIYTIYSTDVMNPWRPFLLFAKQDNNWEPIRTSENKFFDYNDNIIKKILSTSEIKYYDNGIINKDYILVDNLNEIMNDYNVTNTINDSSNSMDSENTKTFIKKDVKNNLSQNKLNKMTKDELITYMKSLNLKPNSKSTKKDLIQTVLAEN